MNSAKVIATCIALGLASSVIAQPMTPQRVENVTWHSVEFIKFDQGKRARAMEIIENYFAAADRDLGNVGQVMDLHLDTGEWDVIVAFPMSGGPNDMTWQTSPEEIEWMNAVAKRAGGMEQARALMAEWDTLIARRQNHIAHRHPNW